jgi:hypothetical protein
MGMSVEAVSGLLAFTTSLLALAAPVPADVGVPGTVDGTATGVSNGEAGHGVVELRFQAIETDGSFGEHGDIVVPFTSTKGQYVLLDYHYAVDDHWRLFLGLPYVQKRFHGGRGHDPSLISPPVDGEYVDDGEYHGGFQDLRVGASYYLHGQLWELAPFARIEYPTHSYPHYASAAIGQNVWRFELGADYVRHLPFTHLYYGVGYSYTVVEETLGVNVNYSRLPLQLGYFFSPRWGAEIFAEGRYGKGRDGEDYPCAVLAPNGSCLRPVLDSTWYQHDRQLKHNYAISGIRVSYVFTERHAVSLSTWRMVWGRSVHHLENALEVSLSQRF